jgi:hypothetical protein
MFYVLIHWICSEKCKVINIVIDQSSPESLTLKFVVCQSKTKSDGKWILFWQPIFMFNLPWWQVVRIVPSLHDPGIGRQYWWNILLNKFMLCFHRTKQFSCSPFHHMNQHGKFVACAISGVQFWSFLYITGVQFWSFLYINY